VIDIDHLNEMQLIDLNHRIVTRLRVLRELRAHASMLEFHIGERVTFYPEGRPAVTGTITRYNKKTVTVVTDCGHQRWNVAPQLLERAAAPTDASARPTNVTALLPWAPHDVRRAEDPE
jgi:hypothetical protein